MQIKSNHEKRWRGYCRVCKNSYESPTTYAITIGQVVGSGWESGCEDPLVEVFGCYSLVLKLVGQSQLWSKKHLRHAQRGCVLWGWL